MDTHLTETLQFEYPPPDSVDSKQTLDGSSHNSPPPHTLDCLLNLTAAPPDSNPDDHSDSALFGGVDSQKNEENNAFNSSHWSSMGWDSRGGTKTSASASGWSDWPSVEDTKPSSLDWSDSMPLQEETGAKVSDSVSPDWSSEAKPAMVGAGLANLGITCFLNAILQCFTHMPLLQCCNCGHSSDTYEPLIDLSLEIENVGTFPSALESFTKVEKIEDPETKFTCEQCKEKVSVEKQLILNQAPSVAAFHLKRFKNDGSYVEKIDKHVEFPLELDLLPYTGGDQNNDVSVWAPVLLENFYQQIIK
ncbi:Ubiquitin carboxyl-terminal hydrolase 20 [Camellia lanceoleosa]|uniref:Ubiquitin carboxyl-terminal hydrolase 20 n=1 Tax=Camellia lanceoleosa TaxID=1840588 RepID=A0ACC0HBU4_9ERIC|nr:Ubiquitin carboxyl-terminal hydrolase 20 [Camellia lanceoleosa]